MPGVPVVQRSRVTMGQGLFELLNAHGVGCGTSRPHRIEIFSIFSCCKLFLKLCALRRVEGSEMSDLGQMRARYASPSSASRDLRETGL